jgi:ribosomal protein S18 acetylase RimI-like enzyme
MENPEEETRQISERVSFRPAVKPDDEEFLQRLYRDTRGDLTAIVSDEAQVRQLLLMQYAGQMSTYSAEFPNAKDQIVMLDGEPVGRLLLDHRQDSIHGVDIAMLEEARNLGVGTAVLDGLFKECSRKGVRFTLSVVKNNPAIRLYERLGCRIDGDNITHFSMTWRPYETR